MSRHNVEEWNLPPDLTVSESNGTLRERMARPGPDRAPGGASFLSDASRLLGDGDISREIAYGVVATRAPGGGVSLSSGKLRRALAEAELDARLKLPK